MKVIIVIIMGVFTSGTTSAQNWAEWFRQKKTQKKYLLEQIAALKVYAGYLEKGYDIANGGLQAIQDFKQGEFELHGKYFQNLKQVNARVLQYPEGKDILSLQKQVLNLIQQIRKSAKDPLLNDREKDYLVRVSDKALSGCQVLISELNAVVSNGELEMQDNERIDRIDQLHLEMLDQLQFCRNFYEEMLLLLAYRANTLREVKGSKILNNIK